MSFREMIEAKFVSKPELYGVAFGLNGKYELINNEEFTELTLGINSEYAKQNNLWCPGAIMSADLPGEREGLQSIFIWTRGAYAKDETEIFNLFDSVINNEEEVASATIRQHAMLNKVGNYVGYYSIEIWLEQE